VVSWPGGLLVRWSVQYPTARFLVSSRTDHVSTTGRTFEGRRRGADRGAYRGAPELMPWAVSATLLKQGQRNGAADQKQRVDWRSEEASDIVYHPNVKRDRCMGVDRAEYQEW
jgi:hypothetical protein